MNHHETVQWYDDRKTIITVKPPHGWSWQDAHTVARYAYEMQQTVPHGTHMIFDIQRVNILPSFSVPNVRRILAFEHPNDRLHIFITDNPFIKMMLDFVTRDYSGRKEPFSYAFAADFQQALAMIAQYEAHEQVYSSALS